jgi:glucose/arabinose dehydrogenase
MLPREARLLQLFRRARLPGRYWVRVALGCGLVGAAMLLGCGGSSGTAPSQQTPNPQPLQLALETVVTGLASPVDVQQPPDGTGRLFIVEQAGMIRIVQGGVLLSTPFLDIRSLVTSGGETGLLGLAFHPGYAQNRRFFLNYTRTVAGQLQSVIAEFQASATDPNAADLAETILLVIDQPFSNHNGGQLVFGPDGYLYMGFGDGGSGGDPPGNGQNLGTLLGKILRIDVNSTQPYAVPQDNPFVGQVGAAPEVWAYGFRNPWRFSFDRTSGRLFVGDVWQDSYEEVDLVTKGGNYGWNIMEGAHCYPPPTTGCNMTGLTLPIAEYSHSEGIAITGGYVYRGSGIPALGGTYVFGDYGSGRIWGLTENPPGTWTRTQLLGTNLSISSFGQDARGELYVVDFTGALYRIRQAM